MKSSFSVYHWGLVDYCEALERQRKVVAEVKGGAGDVLILCEHPAVITLGRKSSEANIFESRQDLTQRGVDVVVVDRGGDVTLHAPGQLILYPIMDLKRAGFDLREYLHKIEQVAVDLLGDFAIVAQGNDDRRGVWVGSDKVASIGIGISRWVTYHGIGININTDLELFRLIRPCGLDVRMTSVQKILGRSLDMADVTARAERSFLKVFQSHE